MRFPVDASMRKDGDDSRAKHQPERDADADNGMDGAAPSRLPAYRNVSLQGFVMVLETDVLLSMQIASGPTMTKLVLVPSSAECVEFDRLNEEHLDPG